jgi:hypothetical protein
MSQTKTRILCKDNDGKKYSTPAWVVWGHNYLNQRRQFATDGVKTFYQPTTRSDFIIVSESELPRKVYFSLCDARGVPHTHICEWCRQPWQCHNGPGCDLDRVEGHCNQECHDHKTR